METNAALCEQARKCGREFVLKITGKVIERSSKNANIPTGEIEIEVTEFEILNESQTPPFTIEDSTDGGDDLRMKYRYLDIRRKPVRDNLLLRHKMSQQTRIFLDAQEFTEVETPVLIKSTPEGARDFVVPSRMNQGQFYALPQSPQTFKQLEKFRNLRENLENCSCDLLTIKNPDSTLNFNSLLGSFLSL
jgi:aspartyl-tRNA synthetase